MPDQDFLTPDFREAPYWWDRAPLDANASIPELPKRVDVAIVGSGFTGLNAALGLLRAGRSVFILDAEDAGYGASRRNAGYLGRTFKRTLEWLRPHVGEARALAIYHELSDAFDTVKTVIKDEGIDCHLDICGRFIGATSPKHYELLAREMEDNKRTLGFPYHMLSRAEQRQEIASDVYYGGALVPDLGSIHPGLYHAGLLRRAMAAGGQVARRTPVTAVEGGSATTPWTVTTPRGTLLADHVIIATNGYTPPEFGWLARRVIPFRAYMAATEPLGEDKLRALLPGKRTYIETTMNINFIRPAPDTTRILFGGKTGEVRPDGLSMAGELRDILRRILPGVGDVKLSHAWTGRCSGTFDFMPHIGGKDRMHYALGYNFAGVPMGTYLGRKLAQRVLGQPEARSVFEEVPFPTMPFYRGNPWFVPLAMRYFDWHDRQIARQSAGQ